MKFELKYSACTLFGKAIDDYNRVLLFTHKYQTSSQCTINKTSISRAVNVVNNVRNIPFQIAKRRHIHTDKPVSTTDNQQQ